MNAGSLKNDASSLQDHDGDQDDVTEDEEVARNCRGGKSGFQDSDLSTDGDDDDDDDDCSVREKEER